MQLNKKFSLHRKFKSICRSEKGQSIILVSVVIMSFLMFFTFAVNTGLLIAAKISLQNAADAAAYAGAATQARQLNGISFLNYDMRRQYKKFLFRYNFIGSIGTRGFTDPNAPAGNGDYDFPKDDFSVNGSGAASVPLAIKVPVVCIPLTTNGKKNDNCLMINLPNTTNDIKSAFPGGGLTQITSALIQQINDVQAMQTQRCKGQGQINFFILLTWLFRGDTDVAALTTTMEAVLNSGGVSAADKASTIATVKALVQGLGLFPRNILNLMRIETLEKFLNHRPETEVQADTVTAWAAAPNAEGYERTIQAFKSAAANLNRDVMDPSDMKMDELEMSSQFKHEDITASFNTYVQMMKDPTGTNDPTICNASIKSFPVQGAPLGIKRTGPSVTHYAVKLRAKARLMFLPIRDGIELEAVGSAKPFGSRIGPANLAATEFIATHDPPVAPINSPDQKDINDCSGVVACNSPDLKLSGNNSFYTAKYLKKLVAIASGGGARFGYDGIMKAQAHAMAPNATEVGRYNILPPAQDLNDIRGEFIPYSFSKTSTVYRFYAPLFENGQGDVNTKIDQFLSKMFASVSVGVDEFGISQQDMKQNLAQTLSTYIQKLEGANAPSENGESLTFAGVELPMRQSDAMEKQPEYWLTEPKEVLSSWVGSGTKPRFGYSVKFVTMQKLLQIGVDDSTGDLEKVSH